MPDTLPSLFWLASKVADNWALAPDHDPQRPSRIVTLLHQTITTIAANNEHLTPDQKEAAQLVRDTLVKLAQRPLSVDDAGAVRRLIRLCLGPKVVTAEQWVEAYAVAAKLKGEEVPAFRSAPHLIQEAVKKVATIRRPAETEPAK